MNKQELIAEVALKTNVTKKEAQDLVGATFDVIEEALIKGEKVQILGFATFETKTSSARTARNIKTGELIKVPPKKRMSVRISRSMTDKLNS